MEGVMMRGPASWAVAIRKPDGEIAVEAYTLNAPRSWWTKVPFLRGSHVLFSSLSIGMKALRISARYALEPDESAEAKAADRAIGMGVGLALVVFSTIFIALPAFLARWGGGRLGFSGDLQHNLIEGAVRIGFFVGYILLVSLLPDIRRVFQYHGAEHKTIYAYENDDPFDTEVIDRYPTMHVRCGTNFLFIVMVLTVVGHFVLDVVLTSMGVGDIATRIALRVLAIPILAGVSYEVIRAAGRKGDSRALHIVSLPGLALQKITTRPPAKDQIEVAIKAIEAVIAREALVEPSVVQPQLLRAPSILNPQPDPATPN